MTQIGPCLCDITPIRYVQLDAQLKQASAKAADALQGSCPTQIGETPAARLDAMSNRLDAMVHSVKDLRPTLSAFYASLSDEQKAQFNAMGQQDVTPQGNPIVH